MEPGDEVLEAAPGRPVLREDAHPRLGVRPRPRALLSADRHAELLGLEHARGAARADVADERLRDVACEVLLEDEPVGERVDELHDLPEPDHPAARHVGDVRHAARRQEVVRADRVVVDPGDGHEVAAGARQPTGEDRGGVAPVAVDEVLEPRLRHPARRVGEIGGTPNVAGEPERIEEARHGLRRRGRGWAATRVAERSNRHPAPGT